MYQENDNCYTTNGELTKLVYVTGVHLMSESEEDLKAMKFEKSQLVELLLKKAREE